MFLGNILLTLLITVQADKIMVDQTPSPDISMLLQITAQYEEISVIVFCFDGYTENSWFIEKLTENFKFTMFLVNYEENDFLPESTKYFYVLSFYQRRYMKKFIATLNPKIQALLVLSHNVMDDINILQQHCHYLNVYIYDVLLQRFIACMQDTENEIAFATILKSNHFPQIRDISNFKGKKFKVGLIEFPLRMSHR